VNPCVGHRGLKAHPRFRNEYGRRNQEDMRQISEWKACSPSTLRSHLVILPNKILLFFVRFEGAGPFSMMVTTEKATS
jgi:hypothetical protein